MNRIRAEDIATIAATDLGAPAGPDAARCSGAAIEALARAAGPDMRLTQLQLDLSSRAIDAEHVAISAQIDKRTRSIVFASAEARAGDALVFKAQALFTRT